MKLGQLQQTNERTTATTPASPNFSKFYQLPKKSIHHFKLTQFRLTSPTTSFTPNYINYTSYRKITPITANYNNWGKLYRTSVTTANYSCAKYQATQTTLNYTNHTKLHLLKCNELQQQRQTKPTELRRTTSTEANARTDVTTLTI